MSLPVEDAKRLFRGNVTPEAIRLVPASGVTSAELFPAKANRAAGSRAKNDTLSIMYVTEDTSEPSSSNYSEAVPAGGTYVMDFAISNVIKVIWSGSPSGNAICQGYLQP